MYQSRSDEFSRARGKSSLLDITCEHCRAHICYYQKDGPGSLRRLYIDRMIDLQPVGEKLVCSTCKRELGVRIIWHKENRPAYRMFVESVMKSRVSRKTVS